MRIARGSPTDWQRMGAVDPYWAVLTDDKFRAKQLTSEALSEFFTSGEAHIDSVLQTIRDVVDPGFAPERCLDFGCGVGRCLLPLARRCREAVGVDVASSMLDEAKANLARHGLTGELIVGDDDLSAVRGSFDFVHSYIVLQHIPAHRGERIIARLMELLRPGGVAALHIAYANDVPSAQKAFQWARLRVPLMGRLWNIAKRRPASMPYIEVFEYDLPKVFEILTAAGCTQMHATLTNHGGLKGVFLFCRKPPVPPT